MRVLYKKIDTPFEYPFTISGGRTKSSQPAMIVGLNLGNFIGWGEAPAITYYNVTVESMIEELECKKDVIEKFALIDPERFWHFLHHLFPDNPFLVCALDIAGWDLFGKLDKQPIYKIWDLEWKNTPLTDYTIGIDTPEKMLEKLKQHPWPIYKIKLGTEDDIAILKEIRNVTSSPIRIDANAGWTLEKALNILPELEKLDVELIEQPLAKDNWADMKILKEKSNIPLIADESCVSEHDVLKCAPFFHGINIKLTKCSGMTPAKRMVQEARSLSLKVMMGSMNETNIGSAAIAQFLPILDYVDMDGPILLKEDDMEGLNIENGIISLSGGYGLGIRKKK
ncbi:dipeptide epimerase [Rhizosphaericola mali]|uniref:Dipeptide epimerase n=1 Tax=Rhizosphaericola mali TaxID=2545455 RepID=A0A5P2FXZ0_9BACT|nr:dipeptide epimerase [Rhizosphaericola mali]QES87807.1 dipeptide epimerase [Rhizosphaericola mali]